MNGAFLLLAWVEKAQRGKGTAEPGCREHGEPRREWDFILTKARNSNLLAAARAASFQTRYDFSAMN